MMGEQNRDHVAVHADRDVMYWVFDVPSRVETCEAQASEMVSRCETLFETFDDFIVPTEITYAISRFPPGQHLPVEAGMEEHRETIGRELRDESGISVNEFHDSTLVSEPGSRWIPLVDFDGTEVMVRLTEGDVTASRYKNTVKYRKGKPVEDGPTRDPIELTVAHRPNPGRFDTDAEYVTRILVAPLSDIWFEDTDIGATNRRYLAAFLERIEEAFPVVEVERTSEWVPLSDLEAVY